jgi:hypothetical protein
MDLLDQWYKHTDKNDTKSSTNGENVFKKVEDKYRCSTCSDKGYHITKGKAIKCKECDGVIRKDGIIETDIVEVNNQVERLNIPEFYKDKEFTPELLKKEENLSLSIRNDIMMDLYIKNLRKIMDYFVLGKKLDNSFIVMAPQGYSKSHFVFGSMIEALKRGFTVAPYYDTSEIYKMYYSDDLMLKEVFESDICFIKVMTSFVSKKDTQAIKFVLDKRARRNLPTIVISRFNMGYLSDIEPHLGNNFGLKHVDKGDFSKLKELLGPYPKNYTRYSDSK